MPRDKPPPPIDYRGVPPRPAEEIVVQVQVLPGLGMDRSPRLQALARGAWRGLRVVAVVIVAICLAVTGWLVWRGAYHLLQ